MEVFNTTKYLSPDAKLHTIETARTEAILWC